MGYRPLFLPNIFASRILLLCTDNLCCLIFTSLILSKCCNIKFKEKLKTMHPEAQLRDFLETVCLPSDQKHSILFAPLSTISTTLWKYSLKSFLWFDSFGNRFEGRKCRHCGSSFQSAFLLVILVDFIILNRVFMRRALWFIRLVWELKMI